VATSRILRLSLGALVGWTKLKNPVSRFFRPCFCCCDQLLTTTMPWCKDAYIDVAMNGRPFFAAAKSYSILAKQSSQTLQILRGATTLFQVFGVFAAATIGALTMFLYSWGHQLPPHTTYVLTCSGAVISFSTAMLYIMIFETVSNAILYCTVVEHLRSRKTGSQSGEPGGAVMAMFCPCVFRRELDALAQGDEAVVADYPPDLAVGGDVQGPEQKALLDRPVVAGYGDGGGGGGFRGAGGGNNLQEPSPVLIALDIARASQGGGRPIVAPARVKGKGKGKGQVQGQSQGQVLPESGIVGF